MADLAEITDGQSQADSSAAPDLSAKEKQRLRMEAKKQQSGMKKGKGELSTNSGTSAKSSASKSKNSKGGKTAQKSKEKEEARKELARKQFNAHYAKQFGTDRWAQLLFALEGPTRYSCLVNRYCVQSFIDQALSHMQARLEKLNFLSFPCYAVKQEPVDYDAAPRMEDLLPFPQPARDEETGTLNYYLLDAASLLAVEALNVKPNDTVLDLCAAPGGKSLAILQKLDLGDGCTGSLTANELSMERRKRLKGVLHGCDCSELQSFLSIQFLIFLLRFSSAAICRSICTHTSPSLEKMLLSGI